MIFPADPPPVDVQRELAAMRAELAAIRCRMQDGWMDGERARQVRAVVEDALADSATRASFGDAGWTVSYDSGATIRSGDGAMSANFTVLEQVRFLVDAVPAHPSATASTAWARGESQGRVEWLMDLFARLEREELEQHRLRQPGAVTQRG